MIIQFHEFFLPPPPNNLKFEILLYRFVEAIKNNSYTYYIHEINPEIHTFLLYQKSGRFFFLRSFWTILVVHI